MTLTLGQKENFYRNKGKIKRIILDNAENKGHIVHGARALNKIFPPFLDTQTDDWDLFSSTPKETAIKVEKKLDKKFGGDFFRTQQGRSPTTHKIKSNVTGKTVADYTIPDRKIPFDKIDGVNYANTEHFKRRIKDNLVDPKKEFRRDKDLDQLNRIKIFEKLKKKPKTFTEMLGEIDINF